MPDVDSIFPDLVNHDLYLCPGDPAQVSVGAGQQAGRVPAHSKQDFVNTVNLKEGEAGVLVRKLSQLTSLGGLTPAISPCSVESAVSYLAVSTDYRGLPSPP